MTNLSLKIISIVIAIILWFVVLGSRSVEVTKEVPLEVVPPKDLVIASEIPSRIAFRISGPQAFLRNILHRRETPIRINLTDAKEGSTTYRIYSDQIQVPLGVKVVFVNPSLILVKLEKLAEKDVSLNLKTKNTPESGYRVRSLQLMKKEVTIRGPRSLLATIHHLDTIPIDLSALKTSVFLDATVDTSRYPGVYSTDRKVQIKVLIENRAHIR